jgi:uncharacterized protein (DUF302 family)
LYLDFHRVEYTMSLDGLTTIASSFGPKETLDRLEAQIRSKGLTVFVRVDHAAGAAAVGMTLRPTEVVLFGNARGGTPLMQDKQTAGIDLPLKCLVWQDEGGKTWLSYNEPGWIAHRHGLATASDAPLKAMTGLLAALAKAATSP